MWVSRTALSPLGAKGEPARTNPIRPLRVRHANGLQNSLGPIYSLSLDDFAQRASPDRGGCFKWLSGHDAKLAYCKQPVIASGWLEIDDQWYLLKACGRHSGELRFRGQRKRMRRTSAPRTGSVPTIGMA